MNNKKIVITINDLVNKLSIKFDATNNLWLPIKMPFNHQMDKKYFQELEEILVSNKKQKFSIIIKNIEFNGNSKEMIIYPKYANIMDN